MSIEVKPVAESSTCSFLLFADAGGGKTTFIGSGGGEMKILLIRSPEDHVDCILGSGVDEVIVRDWEEMTEVQSMLHHEGSKYDWVWLEFGLWQDRGLRDILESAVDRAGPVGSAARKHRASFGADKGEYKTNMDRLSSLVADLSSSESFHFGMTAHAWVGPRIKTEDEVSEDEPEETVQPWVQGRGMIAKLAGMFNIVGYLYITKATVRGQTRSVRKIQFDKTPSIYVKNQIKKPDGTSIIPEGSMINPTLPKFMEAYNTRQRPKRRPATTSRPARGRRGGRG